MAHMVLSGYALSSIITPIKRMLSNIDWLGVLSYFAFVAKMILEADRKMG